MLHIDIVSAYAICGAGSLVGVAMMLLADVDLPVLRRAVRRFAQGFGFVGVGLFQIGYAVDDGGAHQVAVLVATGASVAGISLFAAGFSWLAGKPPWRGLAATTVVLLAVLAGAWFTLPSVAFALVYNAEQLGVTMSIAWSLRPRLAGQGSPAERAMAWSVLAFAATWVLRLVATATYQGPPLFHIAYVPPGLLAYLGAFYGVIPVIIAAMVLNVVNAQLATRLRVLALTDPLTGTRTRHALSEIAPRMLARERREGRRMAAAMVDLDHFKSVNDRHGHAGGDAVLRHAGELMRTHLRRDAVVTRYGGEEFLVLMPVSDIDEARMAAERLRAAFADARHPGVPEDLRVTISVGLALVDPDEGLEATLRRADEALYRAKHGGRDRVEVAGASAAEENETAPLSVPGPACAGPSR